MILTPIVLINIGWMKRYAGLSADDPTLGGHGHLKEHKSGHEAWNFLPYNDKMYGYVPRSARINITKLGGNGASESATEVTVVWIARSPRDKKTYIVGWYVNATVFRNNDQITLKRKGANEVRYQVVASAGDATLLPISRRLFPIATAKVRGNLGQSPVWYGGSDEFRASVLAYVLSGGLLDEAKKKTGSAKRQVDPELRKQIELAAVRHATSFYESVEGGSQTVVSVEKDGAGWDLEVTAPTGASLKVEVKGLSGSDVVVELTPNEYKQMLAPSNRSDYVVYIVTEANSSKAQSHVFLHNKEASRGQKLIWATSDGRKLKIEERRAARLSAASAN